MNKLYVSTLLAFLLGALSSWGYSQSIPQDYPEPVCDGQSITTGAPGNSGYYNILIPCSTQPLSPYIDFYYVRIQSGTTFTFVVDPVGNDDYDFGAWLNPNWNNLNATPANNKRGSQNDPTITGMYNLGLSLTATDTCEGAGSTGYPEPGMVRYFDVQPGDEILIAIDRWSNTTQGYTISFGGDAVLDCTILGDPYGKCDYDNNNVEQFELNDFLPGLQAEYPGHTFEFYQTENAAETGTGPQVSFPFTVNYNGGDPTDLFVRVKNSSGVFIRVLRLLLFVNKLPTLLTQNYTLPVECDPDGDGQATFDLTQVQPFLVSNPAGFSFRYYTNLADAESGNNNFITNPVAYTSGSGQIFVRVNTGPLDGNEQGCHVVATLNLLVSPFDVPSQTHTVPAICDEDGNGTVLVNLNDYITQFVANPVDYLISYHTTAADANTGNNPIANPNNYAIPAGTSPTIYIRIKSISDPCFSVSTLIINTLTRPVLQNPNDVEECVDQLTGNYSFDLTTFNSQVVADPQNYTITYHISQADADNGTNPIANPTAYPVPLNTLTTIYIRVERDGCPNTVDVNIEIYSRPEVGPDMQIENVCDENGDGNIVVNLTENEALLLTNPANYQITYHTTQADADSGNNPIPNPISYTIPAGQSVTVFIRVKNLTNECFTIRSITYSTLERPSLNNLPNEAFCVDQTSGEYIYDLTQHHAQVVANPNAFTITWHGSQADADAGINPIGAPNAFPIPVNSTLTLYVRVDNNGCYDTRSLTIQINSNPVVQDIANQVFCSTQVTGTVTYDLTQHINDWVNDPTGMVFTYHTTLNDAQNGTNPIVNPANHQIPVGQTTTIYVRIENGTSGCFSVTTLTLYPGATATLNTGVEIALCDEDFDGIYHYTLPQMNSLLVANTTGLTFAYYLSEEDALENLNPIAQSQWNDYSISTLPYDIWVVAFTTDQCPSDPVRVRFIYGTDITLSNPVIGPVEYCQEDIFDLSDFNSQLTNEPGVIFSYHLNLTDAENNLNPIANSSSFHPQGNMTIYVRLEKPQRCPVIAEIRFELLPTPSIELNETYFELCPGTTFEAVATSDDPNATFIWYAGETQLGTGDTFSFTQSGIYTVVVMGANGCENEATLTLATPLTPVITGIEIGSNYFIISASSGDGGGILEYSLDGIFWQSTPRFDDLIPGESYTVYVREDGCMMDSYEVAILAISNFISPNDDGKNDTWAVRGIEVTPQATLKIFDRYGKIFVDTNFEGNYTWDGKYMGRPVPSGDYWYIMEIPSDGIIKDQKFIGHISVRNQ